MPKPKYQSLREWCDQCQALAINGTPCHEAGCPNEKKVKIEGKWAKVYACVECGCDVLEGETCSCYDEGYDLCLCGDIDHDRET